MRLYQGERRARPAVKRKQGLSKSTAAGYRNLARQCQGSDESDCLPANRLCCSLMQQPDVADADDAPPHNSSLHPNPTRCSPHDDQAGHGREMESVVICSALGRIGGFFHGHCSLTLTWMRDGVRGKQQRARQEWGSFH